MRKYCVFFRYYLLVCKKKRTFAPLFRNTSIKSSCDGELSNEIINT